MAMAAELDGLRFVTAKGRIHANEDYSG